MNVRWDRCPRCKCDIKELAEVIEMPTIYLAPAEQETGNAPIVFSWFSENINDCEPRDMKRSVKYEPVPESCEYVFDSCPKGSVWIPPPRNFEPGQCRRTMVF